MEPTTVFSTNALVSARTNAIVPVAPEKVHSFGDLEEEERRAIQIVAKKVKSIHQATMFSTKTLPSRLIIKFVGIPSIGIEELRLINISNHRIRAIQLMVMLRKSVFALPKSECSIRH